MEQPNRRKFLTGLFAGALATQIPSEARANLRTGERAGVLSVAEVIDQVLRFDMDLHSLSEGLVEISKTWAEFILKNKKNFELFRDGRKTPSNFIVDAAKLIEEIKSQEQAVNNITSQVSFLMSRIKQDTHGMFFIDNKFNIEIKNSEDALIEQYNEARKAYQHLQHNVDMLNKDLSRLLDSLNREIASNQKRSDYIDSDEYTPDENFT